MKPAVMIDIETFDTVDSAVILSIGAVRMDMESLGVIHDQTFYMELDTSAQLNAGRTQSKDTINWWLQQGKCPCMGTVPFIHALKDLFNWIEKDSEIWCKGTDFDTKILAHAFKQCGIPTPWKYNAVRDCRTIFKTFPLSDTGNIFPASHNALEDAKSQADQLMFMLKRLSYGS